MNEDTDENQPSRQSA